MISITTHDHRVITADMITAHRRYLVVAGYAESTIRGADELLTRVDTELPFGLPTASPEELVGWLARPHWSTQTRKTYRDHLARFFAWAANPTDPWIDRDPTAGLPRLRVPARLPRPATHEQARICLTQTSPPWRLCCLLAAYAGLRPCEIARLHREHVDPQWLSVHQGKGGRSRRVPTHPLVWRVVEPMPAGPLVRRPDGAPVSPAWVSKRTAEVLRRVYRLPIALYSLRHWYGTYIQAGQGDNRVTQELMGHASPVTTAGYTAVSDGRLRAAVDTLPTFTG